MKCYVLVLMLRHSLKPNARALHIQAALGLRGERRIRVAGMTWLSECLGICGRVTSLPDSH
jgi:hypothetical protein